MFLILIGNITFTENVQSASLQSTNAEGESSITKSSSSMPQPGAFGSVVFHGGDFSKTL